MKPLLLDINSDPDKHSGQFRLQKFVSSMLAETGMPFIDIFPVKELIKNEYPDPKKLKNLIKVLSIGQVKLDEPHIIEFKHKHVMNIIFNHMRFPRLSGTGIIPLKLKSKLYYDER